MKITKKNYKKLITRINALDRKLSKMGELTNELVQEYGKADYALGDLIDDLEEHVEE